MSRYRRLNVIFDRKAEHFLAHVSIAFASIIARRLARSGAYERVISAA